MAPQIDKARSWDVLHLIGAIVAKRGADEMEENKPVQLRHLSRQAFKLGVLCGFLCAALIWLLSLLVLRRDHSSASVGHAHELLRLDKELHEVVLREARDAQPLEALREGYSRATETRLVQALSMVSGLFQALDAAVGPLDKDGLLVHSVQHAKEQSAVHMETMLSTLKAELTELSSSLGATVSANTERYRAQVEKIHIQLGDEIRYLEGR